MFDKALALVVMLFVFLPIIIFTLIISWAMDDERVDKRKLRDDNNNRNVHDDVHNDPNSSMGNIHR